MPDPHVKPTGREHCLKKNCGECPFTKSGAAKPAVKSSVMPLQLIGQIQGPFWLPCHSDPDYAQKQTQHHVAQCAGAAIFRSNLGIAKLFPKFFHILPADRSGDVFQSLEEFLATYWNITIEQAKGIFTTRGTTLKELAIAELVNKEAKYG